MLICSSTCIVLKLGIGAPFVYEARLFLLVMSSENSSDKRIDSSAINCHIFPKHLPYSSAHYSLLPNLLTSEDCHAYHLESRKALRASNMTADYGRQDESWGAYTRTKFLLFFLFDWIIIYIRKAPRETVYALRSPCWFQIYHFVSQCFTLHYKLCQS